MPGIRGVLLLTAELAQVHEKSAVVFQHFIMELLAVTVLIVTLVILVLVLRKRNGLASIDRENESSFFQPLAFFYRFDFISSVKKTMARLAHHTKIVTWIVVDYQSELHPAFHILLDRFDHRDFSIKNHVHRVGPLLRADAHPVAGFDFDSGHIRGF